MEDVGVDGSGEEGVSGYGQWDQGGMDGDV